MKQRLIGAAVLVALAVIFLPMLLDRPAPEPGADSVRLDIPAPPDRDFETRELPLQPPAPAAAAQQPVAREPVVAVDADVAPREDARPEEGGTAAPPASAAAAPAQSAPAAAAGSQEPATVQAEPPAAPSAPPPPAPVTDGRFAVNLGSFANEANADALESRLRAAGVQVYGESIDIDGRPARRLRAGPFAVRGEAEAARIAVRRVAPELAATVVTLDAEAAAPAHARSGFAVQVGAFRDRADALALRDRLRKGGITAFVDDVRTDAGILHRVRAGPETERSRAETLKRTLAQKFQLDGLVVTHP